MKITSTLCVFFILFCSLFTINTYAINFPNKPLNTDFYVDNANIITPDAGKEINNIIGTLWKEKHVPMIVVTITSLADENANTVTVDQYATLLFNHWGLGSQQNNNGVLFLISKNDRHARIEFGGSWAHTYDSQAKTIMDNNIVPAFKMGDYSKGIVSGVKELDKLARDTQGFTVKPPQPWWFFPALILGIFVMIGIIISLLRSGRKGIGWIVIAGLALLIFFIIRFLLSRGGSGGMFGGGSSGGGGGSGSW